MVEAVKKNIIACESFKSVCSCSSADISLSMRSEGLFIAITIMPTAIPKSIMKLISKDLNLFVSHTTR